MTRKVAMLQFILKVKIILIDLIHECIVTRNIIGT